MKKMRKSFTMGIAAFALCLMFCLFIKVDASAGCKLCYLSSDGKSVSFELPRSDDYGYIVSILNRKKKPIATTQCAFYAVFTNKLKPKTVYYVKYKKVFNSDHSESAWSKAKPFITLNKISVTFPSKKSMIVKFKMPKITGVKNYTIYISTSKNKGFRKVKAVNPGSVVKLNKFKGKSFKKYKNYYFKIVPKVGSDKTDAFLGYFWFY